jgi:hypothetical protein
MVDLLKRARCLVLGHKWARHSLPNSGEVLRCRRCGKDDEGGSPHWGAPMA